jgi:FkbH-like protein
MDPFSDVARSLREARTQIEAALPERAVLAPVDGIVLRRGIDAWYAPRYWERTKAPAHPDAIAEVGVFLADVIARLHRPLVRGVVVDLDDTLWGGLVGEVGAAGLQLDPDGEGRAYLELQHYLLSLHDRGVAIGVVSKNDPDIARTPFHQRSEMTLRLDHLLSFDASWQPKAEGIARFASALNVAVDAVCFLDDSAIERDQARALLPGLIVPDLPDDPGLRVRHLVEQHLFLAPRVLESDRLRVEDLRTRLQDRGDHTDVGEYLRGLDMVLDTSPIDASSFDRALALLHKTNQFNLTLHRPSAGGLQDHITAPGGFSATYRLGDRLGDSGIIGVILAHVADRDVPTVIVDAWVLSCRAFQRGVEWAMAQHLAMWADAIGATAIEVPFVAGPRNAMVAGLPERLGLVPRDQQDAGESAKVWIGRRLEIPNHHLRITGGQTSNG